MTVAKMCQVQGAKLHVSRIISISVAFGVVKLFKDEKLNLYSVLAMIRSTYLHNSVEIMIKHALHDEYCRHKATAFNTLHAAEADDRK